MRSSSYPKVAVASGGLDPIQVPVTITAGTTVQSFSVRRDWAAASGGASVAAFDGPDFTPFGCGPINAIDQSQAAGWGSTADLVGGLPDPTKTPKSITIHLPRTVDIAQVSVNPTAVCGDGGGASTGDYKLEVSTNGTERQRRDHRLTDSSRKVEPQRGAAAASSSRHQMCPGSSVTHPRRTSAPYHAGYWRVTKRPQRPRQEHRWDASPRPMA